MHAITWMLIMAFTVALNAAGTLATDEAAKKEEVRFDDTQKVDAKEEKKVAVEIKKVEEKKDVVAPAAAVK